MNSDKILIMFIVVVHSVESMVNYPIIRKIQYTVTEFYRNIFFIEDEVNDELVTSDEEQLKMIEQNGDRKILIYLAMTAVSGIFVVFMFVNIVKTSQNSKLIREQQKNRSSGQEDKLYVCFFRLLGKISSTSLGAGISFKGLYSFLKQLKMNAKINGLGIMQKKTNNLLKTVQHLIEQQNETDKGYWEKQEREILEMKHDLKTLLQLKGDTLELFSSVETRLSNLEIDLKGHKSILEENNSILKRLEQQLLVPHNSGENEFSLGQKIAKIFRSVVQ